MWTVRVFWGIRVGVVHPVKDRIGPGREVRATLPKPSEKVKELFPKLVHHEHLMGSIAMEKETLAKQGEIPVEEKEDNNNHAGYFN